MTISERAKLDAQLRGPIRAALAAGADASELVFLLTRLLPELCDRRFAQGNVMAAYDLANRDLDRAQPFNTGPVMIDDGESAVLRMARRQWNREMGLDPDDGKDRSS